MNAITTNTNHKHTEAKTMISVINFTYSVSKSREYHGCHTVTGHFDGVKVRHTGYGYDMIGAVLTSFINQGLISQDFLRESDMSRLNPSSGKYYVNLCTQEAVSLLESYGFTVKLNYLKGTLVSVILVK